MATETTQPEFVPVRYWHLGKDTTYIDRSGYDPKKKGTRAADPAACPQITFSFGVYQAMTPEEAALVEKLAGERAVKSDLPEGQALVCPKCKRSTSSSRWYQYHIGLCLS